MTYIELDNPTVADVIEALRTMPQDAKFCTKVIVPDNKFDGDDYIFTYASTIIKNDGRIHYTDNSGNEVENQVVSIL